MEDLRCQQKTLMHPAYALVASLILRANQMVGIRSGFTLMFQRVFRYRIELYHLIPKYLSRGMQ